MIKLLIVGVSALALSAASAAFAATQNLPNGYTVGTNSSDIEQIGSNNSATVDQQIDHQWNNPALYLQNYSSIEQHGNDKATVTQFATPRGTNSFSGADNNHSTITQRGQSLQNTATVNQSTKNQGRNLSTIDQEGSGNTANVGQVEEASWGAAYNGAPARQNTSTVIQRGDENKATVYQGVFDNNGNPLDLGTYYYLDSAIDTSTINQPGSNNTATVKQTGNYNTPNSSTINQYASHGTATVTQGLVYGAASASVAYGKNSSEVDMSADKSTVTVNQYLGKWVGSTNTSLVSQEAGSNDTATVTQTMSTTTAFNNSSTVIQNGLHISATVTQH